MTKQTNEEFDRDEDQPELPPVGDILETLRGDNICAAETKSEKGCSVRCAIDGDEWYIHNERGGLVVILKPEPVEDFNSVKITGHARSRKCVFGKAVH